MNLFTVALFGHRAPKDIRVIEERLEPIIRGLLDEKQFVVFLVGRNGTFDEVAASVIKRVQRERGSENSDLTLVLPYKVKDIDYYEDYYDSTIVPDVASDAHPKSAITVRNQWMIEQSDEVIVYVEKKTGGAYTAMKHALKKNKPVTNLGDI